MRDLQITDIINTQYKDFSFYVLESRAIPYLVDGLKPVQRRVLWKARTYAKNWIKVSKLAGLTMSLHPHGDVSIADSTSNMAQYFTGANNIPYLLGDGAFGSKISGPGNGIGASRYVSVKTSEHFSNILEQDIDLIKMIPNYDDTEQEPESFLPLIPNILLNPVQGIAIGFACRILPRKLDDIKRCMLNYLEGKDFYEPKVYYEGFGGVIEKISDRVWQTTGVFERKGKTKVVITELPIGTSRENYVKILDKLEEQDVITSYEDNCTDTFNFIVNLKGEMTDAVFIEKFKMSALLHENLVVIGFDKKIKEYNVKDLIKEFTDYRIGLYLDRYKKDYYDCKEDFEFKRDLYYVIKKGMFKKFPDLSKDEIFTYLLSENIMEKNIPRIIQVPIYKFGKDEIEKLKADLNALKEKIEELKALCKSSEKRKEKYIEHIKMIKG